MLTLQSELYDVYFKVIESYQQSAMLKPLFSVDWKNLPKEPSFSVDNISRYFYSLIVTQDLPITK